MAWFEDLAPWGDVGPRLRAVGWLSAAHSFTTGDVDTDFFRRLCDFTQNPWAPWVSCGHHRCEFCRFTGGGSANYNEHIVPGWSSRELFIPGDGFLYVSPVSITHYIDAHGYCPPAEFRQAVMNCPP